MSKSRRDIIKAAIGDAVADFVYYNRKEDEELEVGAIEEAMDDNEITLDEIIAAFREELEAALG